MVVEIKSPIFLGIMYLITIVILVMMTLKLLEVVSKERLLKLLLIKEFRPTLNVQKTSVELKLHN